MAAEAIKQAGFACPKPARQEAESPRSRPGL